MRSTRIIIGVVGMALAASLTGCGILPSPLLPFQPRPPVETLAPDAVVGAESCLDTQKGRIANSAELVACGTEHGADVIALIEWPGMDELIAAETAKVVWDELSGNYAQLGLSVDYDDWTADACGDALRELIGWDGITIGGRDARELDLRPGGSFEIVAAVAEAGAFLDGDHRVRCLATWYEPIEYPSGMTIADLATAEFPTIGRDCYLADDEGYMEPTYCNLRHTDQTVVTFDTVAALGLEYVSLDELDSRAQMDADRFCEDAVGTVLGDWDEANRFVWAGSMWSDDWAALDEEPDPAGSYPYGCLLSTFAGEFARDDVFAP